MLPIEHVLPDALERRGDGAIVGGDRHERHASLVLAAAPLGVNPSGVTRPRHVRVHEPHRPVRTASRMAIRDEGTGPAVVFCHGFPELAYSWRHQVPALAAAGFRAIAPDQRGYGGDRASGRRSTSYDMAELDRRSRRHARRARHRARRLRRPRLGRAHRVADAAPPSDAHGGRDRRQHAVPARAPFAQPTAIFRQLFGDNYYVCHFQQPGVADAGARARRPQGLHAAHAPRRADRADRGARWRCRAAHAEHGRDGLRERAARRAASLRGRAARLRRRVRAAPASPGGINWYRNLDRNWEATPHLDGARIDVPSLMVTAEWDAVLRPEMAEPMRDTVADLEIHMIPRMRPLDAAGEAGGAERGHGRLAAAPLRGRGVSGRSSATCSGSAGSRCGEHARARRAGPRRRRARSRSTSAARRRSCSGERRRARREDGDRRRGHQAAAVRARAHRARSAEGARMRRFGRGRRDRRAGRHGRAHRAVARARGAKKVVIGN